MYSQMLVIMGSALQVPVVALQGVALRIDCICSADVCAARTFTQFAHIAHTRLTGTRLSCTHIDDKDTARGARIHTARKHIATYLAHTLHHCSHKKGITASHTLRTFVSTDAGITLCLQTLVAQLYWRMLTPR